MAGQKTLVEYTPKLQHAVDLVYTAKYEGMIQHLSARRIGRSALDGGGGKVGGVRIGVLTQPPNNGFGPAVWTEIIVSSNGTWITGGKTVPVIVPLLK